MPKKFLDIQSEVSDWKVNEEDVWVVSFPKTGKLKCYYCPQTGKINSCKY